MGCQRVGKKLVLLIGVVVLLGFVLEPPSSGQATQPRRERQEEMPEVRELYAAETILFLAPPPLMVQSGMKCDAKGNIYLIYTDSPQAVLSQRDGPPTLPIQKVSIHSKTTAPYAIPSLPEYQHLLRLDFDVDAEGKVYALLSAMDESNGKEKPRPTYLIAKYKDDGTMDSFFKVGDVSGVHTQALRFGVFPDGTFLVTGTTADSGKVATFTAVFDRGGTYKNAIKLSHDAEPVPLEASLGQPVGKSGQGSAPAEPVGEAVEGGENRASPRKLESNVSPLSVVSDGLEVSGPDGNLYLLRATEPPHLYVVSPAGEVSREFAVTAPARELSPIQMGIAGTDELFIQFCRVATGPEQPDENNNATRFITVLNATSGHVTATYRLAPTESASNLPACASSPYNFLFVGTSQDNKLKVVRYAPR